MGTPKLAIKRVRRNNAMGTIPELAVRPNNIHLVVAGGSVDGTNGFALYRTKPFALKGQYNDLATWVDGLAFSDGG